MTHTKPKVKKAQATPGKLRTKNDTQAFHIQTGGHQRQRESFERI